MYNLTFSKHKYFMIDTGSHNRFCYIRDDIAKFLYEYNGSLSNLTGDLDLMGDLKTVFNGIEMSDFSKSRFTNYKYYFLIMLKNHAYVNEHETYYSIRNIIVPQLDKNIFNIIEALKNKHNLNINL